VCLCRTGLYAAAAGAILYALFGTSRQISTGPSSSLAAVPGGAVLLTKLGGKEAAQLELAMWRVTRFDFWVAVAAIIGVLSAGVLAGVVIGVALSLGWLVYVATRPPMPLLGREAGTQVFRDLDENAMTKHSQVSRSCASMVGLFFATAEAFEDRVRARPGTDPCAS
jgi:SulP family sulfate permease